MDGFNALLLGTGGLGLFLIGMIVMTDNLKKLAGNRIRTALFNFTKTPTSGALTGAITTAFIQSSSMTTVAAVGFVGAGLMTFTNSLGIIFGANVGTTITGWMVALLGFKISIGDFAYPIIFLGVLIHLFSKEKWAHIGLAVAGFGLIFVAISIMQEAMLGMHDIIDLQKLPANDFFGKLQLLFLGLIFTIITQSSSAGVALTLTALFTHLIQFEQAILLVIGMDIGTTFTTVIATIGGTVGAKRTGYSHMIYNLLTAVLALFLITPYINAWEWVSQTALKENPEIALVGFHTTFNILGVILILPFTHFFARMIKRLFPKKSSDYTERLEIQLLKTPELALTAVQNTLIDLIKAMLNELNILMSEHALENQSSQLKQLQQELDQTQIYLDHINLTHYESHRWKRLISMIHTLDHLQRLHERCEEESDRAQALKQFPTLSKFNLRLHDDILLLQNHISNESWSQAVECTQKLYHYIRQDAEVYRHKMVQQMGKGELSVDDCWDSLEAIRWIERVSKHLYRISFYLEKMLLDSTLES